jgi:uncharacterized protein YkwD
MLALLVLLAAAPPEAPTEISLTPAAPSAAAPAAVPVAELRARFVALLSAARAATGLAPLTADPALDQVAQRHADDMAAQGYFGFTSPSGGGVDQWVDETGYLAALVGEKLAQAPLARTAEELVAGWDAEREKNAASLFHPEARHLGVGVAVRGEQATYALVLGRAAGEAAASTLDANLADRAPARAEYLARVNAIRADLGLLPLQHDPTLDRPAQEHADALLAALRRGDAPESVEHLADRVQAAQAGIGSYRGVERDMYWGVGKGRIEPKMASLGSSIVLDAPSATDAVAATLALEPTPDLREAGYRRLGLGVAHGEVAGRPRTVWVAVLLRR